jgi:hypothetical protein
VRGPRSMMIAGLAYVERRGAWLEQHQVHTALGIEAPDPEYVALRRAVIASARAQLGGRSGTEAVGEACPCCGSVLGAAPDWLSSDTMYCPECLWVIPIGGWGNELPPWCPVHHARAGRGAEAARAIDLSTFAVIPDADPRSLQIHVPATPDAAGMARASLLALRPQLDSADREIVALLLTELVRALLEPAPDDGEVLEIVVRSTPNEARIDVGYRDARRVSRLGPESDAAKYSSQILEQISLAWEIDVEDGNASALVSLGPH